MITYCIPSKNNLRYLKTCIPSIRNNSYYETNEIIVYVDQDNDGTVEWLKENDVTHLVNTEAEPKGIGYAYDTMFKAAKNNYVIAFHADMVMGYNSDYWMLYYKKKDNVVCATRIEPPLHPPGQEKIVEDFGIWPEHLNMNGLNNYIMSAIPNFKITKGMFAPWLIEKSQHLGHDPIFRSVYEDADLFRRFVLAGYKMVQTWDAMVYHFTCRGGQFAGAEKVEDFQKKDSQWMSNNLISAREYVRKWGGYFKEYGPCEPKPNKKYDKGLNLVDPSDETESEVLKFCEPYFDNICADIDTDKYVEKYQQETSFDLKSKFVSTLNNDIVVDLNLFNNSWHDFMNLLMNFEDVMESVQEPGEYEFEGIKVKVNKVEVKNPKIKLKW